MSLQRKKLITEISLLAQEMAAIVQADTTIKIPHSEWTIGDMTAHLIISQRIIISVLTGKKNPHVIVSNDFIDEASHKLSREFIAGLNKKFLSSFSSRDGTILAKLLVTETDSFFNEIKRFSDKHIVNTHFGRINLLTLLGYSLNHYLLHSLTIAKTLNKPLPVTYANTSLILPFIKVAMIRLYDKEKARDFSGRFIFTIKDVETFSLICSPQGVEISNTIPPSVDCSFSMDSLIFFLLSSGNISQWKVLLLGKVKLRGRKPWLGLKLPTLFKGL